MALLPLTDIPETRQNGRAANLASFLALDKGESIVALGAQSDTGEYLFYTEGGMVKRTACSEYDLRVKRTAALTLKNGDSLIGVEKAGKGDLLFVSKMGMSIRFDPEEAPLMGRTAGGVRAMKLEDRDGVLFAGQIPEEGELCLLSDRGFGKRSFLFDYEKQKRAGKGLKTFDFRKNGSNGQKLVWACPVQAPFTFAVAQRKSPESLLSTEELPLEDRFSKGAMAVPVLLDDDVLSVQRLLV